MTGQALLQNLALAALQVGVAVLLLVLLRPLLLRLTTARVRRVVWLALAVRLLVPLGSPVQNAPLQIGTAPGAVQEQALTETAAAGTPVHTVLSTAPAAGGSSPAAETPQAASTAQKLPLGRIALVVWALGGCAYLVWQSAGYAVFRRRALAGARPAPAAIQVLVEREAKALFLRTPRVYTSGTVHSPLVMGTARPILVLPQGFDVNNCAGVPVLRHELCHLRRGHLAARWLLVLVRALHWANPAVHILGMLALRDMELECDEAVAQGLPAGPRAAYGAAILAALQPVHSPAAGFGSGNKRFARLRLRNLFKTSARRGGTALLVALALAGLLAGCAVGFAPAQGQALVQRAQSAQVLRTDEATGMKVVRLDGEEWHLVEYPAHLRAVNTDEESLARNYIQMKDLRLAGEWEPLGGRGAPFTGVYDGGGFAVGGMKITTPGVDNPGLFGLVDGGTVRNLTLEDPRVPAMNWFGNSEVLVVARINNGTLHNLQVRYTLSSPGREVFHMDGNVYERGPYVQIGGFKPAYHGDVHSYVPVRITNGTSESLMAVGIELFAYDEAGNLLTLAWGDGAEEAEEVGIYQLDLAAAQFGHTGLAPGAVYEGRLYFSHDTVKPAYVVGCPTSLVLGESGEVWQGDGSLYRQRAEAGLPVKPEELEYWYVPTSFMLGPNTLLEED